MALLHKDINQRIARHVRELQKLVPLPDGWVWYPRKIRKIKGISQQLLDDILSFHDSSETSQQVTSLLRILHGDLVKMLEQRKGDIALKEQEKESKIVSNLIAEISSRLNGGGKKTKNIVTFYATHIELELPDNYHYHDDGIVKSLVAHTSELARRYGSSYLFSRGIRFAEVIGIGKIVRKLSARLNITAIMGLCYYYYSRKYSNLEDALKNRADVFVHSYVIEGMGEKQTIWLRGHEETHILITLGRLDVLKKALESIKINPEGLDELDTEAICDVGGFCAVLRNYPNLNNFNIVRVLNPEYMKIVKSWIESHSTWRFDH